MRNNGSGPRGQMTSPNFTTGNYPNSYHESNTIKVDKGHLVKIRFTDFDLAGWIDLKLTSQEYLNPYQWLVEDSPVTDYVEITDGDGTFLGRFGPQHRADGDDALPLPHDTWYGWFGFGSKNKQTWNYGFEGIKIPDITSYTDTVHVFFHTEKRGNATGWRLEWSKLSV